MHIVPILPDILYKLDNNSLGVELSLATEVNGSSAKALVNDDDNYQNVTNNSSYRKRFRVFSYDIHNENGHVGLLLASKAIVQLLMNPILGPLTNRYGFDVFLMTFIIY